MGYYPIKCIRCAQITTNDRVLFDVKSAAGDIFRNDDVIFAEKEEIKPQATAKKSKKSMWDDDDDEGDVVEETTTQSTVELKQYMTFGEILKYSEQNGFEKCLPHYQKIDVTPDFQGKVNSNEDLLIAVSFQNAKGGPLMRANRRFCPCCHCELPSRSGSMPTYNVTVMGTSASGKTVYLSALNWVLSQSEGNLPYRSSLTCVSANKANEDFVNKSNELFEHGVLPGTTQIVLTEPLVVQMTYRLGNKMKCCLLALADMRGEDLVDQDGKNLLARGEFFSRADAFMIIVSPLNMQYIHNILPHGDGEENNTRVHQTLMANISEYILPFFPNGTITAPTVLMMSKSDVLMNNAQILRIPPANAVVAAEPPIKFTGTYFKMHNSGTQTIMKCDQSLYSFMKNTFSSTYFTSFSSLGRNVDIGEDENQNKRITNPNAIRPIRVIDPIIYILISLGFLPDFNRMEAGGPYERNNSEILNRWIAERT